MGLFKKSQGSDSPKGEGYSPLEGGGIQRTEMNCHACSKGFVAELDFDINGNHVVDCPHCGHEHWRTILNGKITEARWGHDNRPANEIRVSKNSVWKSSVIAAKTSAVAAHIRERWMNRSDFNGHG